MSSYAATIILALIILSGCLDTLIAIYLKAKHPGDLRTAPYIARGIVSIIFGAIALSLLRAQVISVWSALVPISFLLMLSQYLLMTRGKRQLIQKGLLDPAELEDKERQTWAKVRAKGKPRYVLKNVLIYGIGGFLMMSPFALRDPEALPLYMWVVVGLFAGFCGGVAAMDRWKRTEPLSSIRERLK